MMVLTRIRNLNTMSVPRASSTFYPPAAWFVGETTHFTDLPQLGGEGKVGGTYVESWVSVMMMTTTGSSPLRHIHSHQPHKHVIFSFLPPSPPWIS